MEKKTASSWIYLNQKHGEKNTKFPRLREYRQPFYRIPRNPVDEMVDL